MSNRATQIQVLAKALQSIVPPAGPVTLQWAAKLFDEHNVRIGEAVAADTAAEPEADEVLAQMKRDALQVLRAKDPMLAQRIETAQATGQTAELVAEFRPNIPAELLAAAEQLEALDDNTQ